MMGEHVIAVYELVQDVYKGGACFDTLAIAYVMVGCDYSPGKLGVTHKS